ncbi:hypothetical protein HY572_06300 [Candidatus Micrarchaeota archaeon]|nr:hypothetical protein [Candidatus Micrarchaeota archaeon]
MASLNIAVIGGDAENRKSVASALGKKATVQDVTTYTTVFQGKNVTVVEPSAYPEKPAALIMALNAADFVVLLSDPSPFLGEMLVALSLLSKSHGCVIGPSDVSAYLAEANLRYETFDDITQAKAHILSKDMPHDADAPLKAWIDQSFDVKGVGAVALGWVKKGAIHVHDELSVFPQEKKIEVRSIQENDVDVKQAQAGDRFGIRFKGLEPGDLSRGNVLGVAKTFSEIEATVSVPKYLKAPPGKTLHAVAGLQSVPCVVNPLLEPGKNVDGLIQFHKPVALAHDDVTLLDLNEKRLRIAGVALGVG